jgi:hypothetical protein
VSKYDWEVVILIPEDHERASELLEAERKQYQRMIQDDRHSEADAEELERHIAYLRALTEGWKRKYDGERAELLGFLRLGV